MRLFRVRSILPLSLLLVLILSISVFAGSLRMSVIDVGQGDSILLQMPNGKTMLVDAGTPDSAGAIFSYLQKAKVTKLDAFVATHPHADHIGSAMEVLRRFPAGLVLDAGFPHTTLTYERFLESVDQQGLKFRLARRGQIVSVDPSVRVAILWPTDSIVESTKDVNSVSVVLKVTYGQVSFLLAGDVPPGLIMESDLKAQVLKVSHHGSRHNTTAAFLAAVGGKEAIISVGAGNEYGHPHREVLDRLNTFGYRTYRTDLHGTVVVTTDGKTYSISTEKKGTPSTGPPVTSKTVKYVGSRKSEVFHLSTCRSVPSIRSENLVSFTSREDAISQGKRPCSICKP